jgi:hypothetical protein
VIQCGLYTAWNGFLHTSVYSERGLTLVITQYEYIRFCSLDAAFELDQSSAGGMPPFLRPSYHSPTAVLVARYLLSVAGPQSLSPLPMGQNGLSPPDPSAFGRPCGLDLVLISNTKHPSFTP